MKTLLLLFVSIPLWASPPIHPDAGKKNQCESLHEPGKALSQAKMGPDETWALFGKFFDEPDGSLPEIALQNLSPAAVARIYEYLSQSAEAPAKDVEIIVDGEVVPLVSVEHPMDFIQQGRAPEIFYILKNMSFAKVPLPMLGCFVWNNEVRLDYKMGEDWTKERVHSFLSLLALFKSWEPSAEVLIPKMFTKPLRKEFAGNFEKFYASLL